MASVSLKAGINFAFLIHNYDPNHKGKQGYCLQGSGGSGKTYDTLFFILTYCRNNQGKGKRIFICRETYAACKDTVLADFLDILKDYGMYDKSNHVESHPQKYIFEGNTISFGGRDNVAAHGKRNNLIYFNELLLDDTDKAYQQLNGRCKEVFIVDYNPIYTEHWVYDKIKRRHDVKFFKSTFLTTKHLPEGERQEKLGYEPTHPEDRHLPMAQRRPHPTNIEAGTADEYMWRVYGEGEAAAAEGVIFRHIKWIDSFPDIAYSYGMDFGFTVDPCVITKNAEDAKNIWIEYLSYHPMETPEEIDEYADAIGINKRLLTTADSSDKYTSETKGAIEMVKSLVTMGWNIQKVKKTKGVMFWINSMKKKKIHIVKNQFYKDARKEAENYRMKTINGQAINQPIDKWNHGFDSARYRHIAFNNPKRRAFW